MKHHTLSLETLSSYISIGIMSPALSLACLSLSVVSGSMIEPTQPTRDESRNKFSTIRSYISHTWPAVLVVPGTTEMCIGFSLAAT